MGAELIPLSQVPGTAGPTADLKALEEGVRPWSQQGADHAFGLLRALPFGPEGENCTKEQPGTTP